MRKQPDPHRRLGRGDLVMRAVVQRVSRASVVVDGEGVGAIADGLLVYLGVGADDDESDATLVADKVANLRIFADDSERMNLSVLQTSCAVLVVSAFTVQADARKGRRPTFETAASHEDAEVLYKRFCGALEELGAKVSRGVFRATMDVESVNAGPICILLDSKKKF